MRKRLPYGSYEPLPMRSRIRAPAGRRLPRRLRVRLLRCRHANRSPYGTGGSVSQVGVASGCSVVQAQKSSEKSAALLVLGRAQRIGKVCAIVGDVRSNFWDPEQLFRPART
jgi:hypothetical protein